MMLTEVLPEALPDAQAVKGFFDSLTWQKVIPPLVLLLVGLVAVRLLLRLFDRAWSVPGWSGPPTPCSGP